MTQIFRCMPLFNLREAYIWGCCCTSTVRRVVHFDSVHYYCFASRLVLNIVKNFESLLQARMMRNKIRRQLLRGWFDLIFSKSDFIWFLFVQKGENVWYGKMKRNYSIIVKSYLSKVDGETGKTLRDLVKQ